MGAKIFRYVLEYLDEDISSLPMRDILNRLEIRHIRTLRLLLLMTAPQMALIKMRLTMQKNPS